MADDSDPLGPSASDLGAYELDKGRCIEDATCAVLLLCCFCWITST
jgi:hypothetical protein